MTLCPHNTGTGRQYRHALPCTPSVVSMLMVRHSRAGHTCDNWTSSLGQIIVAYHINALYSVKILQFLTPRSILHFSFLSLSHKLKYAVTLSRCRNAK